MALTRDEIVTRYQNVSRDSYDAEAYGAQIVKAPMAVVVDAVDANTTYVGYAQIGTATSTADWRIMKILTSGTVTSITYADGDLNYDNVWDDRTGLSYS